MQEKLVKHRIEVSNINSEFFDYGRLTMRGVAELKQLMHTIKKKDQEQQKLAVLRLELNYELAVLYEAMQNQDSEKIQKCKQHLERIRKELIQLNAL